MAFTKVNFAKILLTIAAIQYGIVPPIVDLTDSHVFHAEWPPHARFHMVWLLTVGSGLAAYVGLMLWMPSKDKIGRLKSAMIPGWIVLGGFFAATHLQNNYGGALSDPDHAIMIFGLDGNLFAFSIAAIFQIIASLIILRLR